MISHDEARRLARMYVAAQQRADQQTQARANDLLIQYIHQHPRAQWDGVIWDLCTFALARRWSMKIKKAGA